MAGDSLSLWLQKRLKPFCRSSGTFSPQGLSWISFFISFSAGTVLYASAEKPELALFTIPLLAIRLILDAMEKVLLDQVGKPSASDILISKICGRLGDLSILFGFAFWEEIRVHLVLFAIASMLIISYVGELGRSLGASDSSSGGLLCQTHRLVFVMFFSAIYAIHPESQIMGFSVFEVMFVLFIPLASITLLQRLSNILSCLDN